jgi:hypothetical protein
MWTWLFSKWDYSFYHSFSKSTSYTPFLRLQHYNELSRQVWSSSRVILIALHLANTPSVKVANDVMFPSQYSSHIQLKWRASNLIMRLYLISMVIMPQAQQKNMTKPIAKCTSNPISWTQLQVSLVACKDQMKCRNMLETQWISTSIEMVYPPQWSTWICPNAKPPMQEQVCLKLCQIMPKPNGFQRQNSLGNPMVNSLKRNA